jgi:hypothetical protein
VTTAPRWHPRTVRPKPDTTLLSFVDADAIKINCGAFFDRLESDEEFRTTFGKLLCEPEPGAFFWEMPGLRATTLEREFECAIIKAPALERIKASPKQFAAHFKPGERAVAFKNLGSDATIVAPCPTPEVSWYAHLGVFLRSARPAHHHALWTTLVKTAREVLGPKPTFISTSGLGVPWLHIRLDSAAKYYNYGPFAGG